MSKFRQEGRRYFQTGVAGYIGSGNNTASFTRRGAPSFSKLKQIYGDHLEAYHSDDSYVLNSKELSESLKMKIREQVRRERIRKIRVRVFAIAVSVIVLIALVMLFEEVLFFLFPGLGI